MGDPSTRRDSLKSILTSWGGGRAQQASAGTKVPNREFRSGRGICSGSHHAGHQTCQLKYSHNLGVNSIYLVGILRTSSPGGITLGKTAPRRQRKKSGYIEVGNKGVRQSECCKEEYNLDSMLETVSLTCFYYYNHTQWLAWRTLPSAWL